MVMPVGGQIFRSFLMAQEEARRQQATNMNSLQGVLAARNAIGNIQRQQQLQRALSQLPANATSEQMLHAVTPFATPSNVFSMINSRESAAARAEAAKALELGRQERSDARIEASNERAALARDANEQAQKRSEALRRELAANRPPPSPSWATVKDKNSSTGWSYMDKRTLKIVAQDAPDPNTVDPLRAAIGGMLGGNFPGMPIPNNTPKPNPIRPPDQATGKANTRQFPIPGTGTVTGILGRYGNYYYKAPDGKIYRIEE